MRIALRATTILFDIVFISMHMILPRVNVILDFIRIGLVGVRGTLSKGKLQNENSC